MRYDVQASRIHWSYYTADTLRESKGYVGETDHIRNQPGVIEIRDMYGFVELSLACLPAISLREESKRLIDL